MRIFCFFCWVCAAQIKTERVRQQSVRISGEGRAREVGPRAFARDAQSNVYLQPTFVPPLSGVWTCWQWCWSMLTLGPTANVEVNWAVTNRQTDQPSDSVPNWTWVSCRMYCPSAVNSATTQHQQAPLDSRSVYFFELLAKGAANSKILSGSSCKSTLSCKNLCITCTRLSWIKPACRGCCEVFFFCSGCNCIVNFEGPAVTKVFQTIFRVKRVVFSRCSEAEWKGSGNYSYHGCVVTMGACPASFVLCSLTRHHGRSSALYVLHVSRKEEKGDWKCADTARVWLTHTYGSILLILSCFAA